MIGLAVKAALDGLTAFFRHPLGQLLCAIAIFGGLAWWYGGQQFHAGELAERGRWEARLMADAGKARATEAKQAQAAHGASERVETIREVTRWRTNTIIQRIPTDAPDPARPALPQWFVSLHDEAAVADVPGPADRAGEPDGQASTVTDAQALRVIAENYGACRFDQGRFAELQSLLKTWGMAPTPDLPR